MAKRRYYKKMTNELLSFMTNTKPRLTEENPKVIDGYDLINCCPPVDIEEPITISNCRFAGTIGVVKHAKFVNCVIGDCNCTDFFDCTFVDCDFRKADLNHCDFSKCKFTRCDFGVLNLLWNNFNNCTTRACKVTKLAAVHCSDIGGQCVKFFDKHIPMACPRKGSYIAYKKAYKNRYSTCDYLIARVSEVIVTLEIPKTAKRSSAFGLKCRASEAKVLKIEDCDGNELKKAYSGFKSSFVYRVGTTVTVKDFDTNRFNEQQSSPWKTYR